MPRETFERELKGLQEDILMLGSMVQEAIRVAVEALKKRDIQTSRIVYNRDLLINRKRYEIENRCLILMATQQPMARDLRILAAIFEINTELERIGDYAKGISHINILMGDQPLIIPISDLSTMTEKGLSMLHRALGAFVAMDAETARQIPNEDDAIDYLYNDFHRKLIHEMIANPAIIDQADYLTWAAHNLERLGDRVTNICERIIFVTTGQMEELDVHPIIEKPTP